MPVLGSCQRCESEVRGQAFVARDGRGYLCGACAVPKVRDEYGRLQKDDRGLERLRREIRRARLKAAPRPL